MRFVSFLLILYFNFQSLANSLYCVDALLNFSKSSMVLRSIEQKKQLTFATFNLHHFRYYDLIFKAREYRHEDLTPLTEKELFHIEAMANAVININADIVSLQEVIKVESAVRFNNLFLDGEYEVFYTESDYKSGEGSVNVTLVRKNLLNFLSVDVISHISKTWHDPVYDEKRKLFLRDALELRFFEKGREEDGPVFITINNHLKAKRDRDGDPESKMLREKQIEELNTIVSGLYNRFGKRLAIFSMGDFNDDFKTSNKINALLEPGLVDSTLAFVKNTSPEDWYTYMYFNGEDQQGMFQQLDAILASNSIIDVFVDGKVWPFYKAYNKEYEVPSKKKDLYEMPSDHRPVSLTVDFKMLRERSRKTN